MQAAAEAVAAAVQAAADAQPSQQAAVAQAAAEPEAAAQAAAKAEAPAEQEPSAQEAQAKHGDLDFTAGKELLLDTAAPAIDKATAAGASFQDRVGDASADPIENGSEAWEAGKQVLNDVATYAVENVPAAWAAFKERVGNAPAYTVENGKWALDTGKQVLSDVTSYVVDNAPDAWAAVKDRFESACASSKVNGMWAWDNAYSFTVKHVPLVWAAAKDHGAENASLYKGVVATAVVGAAVLPVAAPVVGAVAAATAVGSLYAAGGDNMVANSLKFVGDKLDAPAVVKIAGIVYGASLVKGVYSAHKQLVDHGAQASKTLQSIDYALHGKTKQDMAKWVSKVTSKVALAEKDFSCHVPHLTTSVIDAMVSGTKDMLVAAGTALLPGLALPTLYDYVMGESGHQAEPYEAFAAPVVSVVGSATQELADAL